MALFAVTTFVIFHFSLNRNSLEGELASGVLWVTLLFAAILGINRLFVAEREEGGFDGILLAPIERSALLAAKATALFLYLAALELVAVPVFALFFIRSGFWEALPLLVAVLALADAAIAVIGALLASIAVNTRARDLLLPLLLLPLTVPVMIAATEATKPLLSLPLDSLIAGKWILVLALYALIFGLLAYALFDFLMED
jgi:heme exporter protein B